MKKKWFKDLMLMALAMFMWCSFAVQAPAEQTDNTAVTYGTPVETGISGSCQWILDEDGQLTICPLTDTGVLESHTCLDFPDFDTSHWSWEEVKPDIKTVVFAPGVETGIGCGYMFYNCPNLVSADMRNLDGSKAVAFECIFAKCPKLETVHLCRSFDLSKAACAEDMYTGSGV